MRAERSADSEQVETTARAQLFHESADVAAAVEARDEQRIAGVDDRKAFDTEQRDQSIVPPDQVARRIFEQRVAFDDARTRRCDTEFRGQRSPVPDIAPLNPLTKV